MSITFEEILAKNVPVEEKLFMAAKTYPMEVHEAYDIDKLKYVTWNNELALYKYFYAMHSKLRGEPNVLLDEELIPPRAIPAIKRHVELSKLAEVAGIYHHNLKQEDIVYINKVNHDFRVDRYGDDITEELLAKFREIVTAAIAGPFMAGNEQSYNKALSTVNAFKELLAAS